MAGIGQARHRPARRALRLTLGTRMALLVLAGMLPLLAYNLATVYSDYRMDREGAGRRALELARGLALSVEAELRARIAAMEVLALSPSLAAGDLDAFRREAEAVVGRAMPGANILLLAEDGQQMMNTAAPAGTPLPRRAAMDNQRRVLATGQPAVSDLYMGLVVGRPIIALDVPVPGGRAGARFNLALNPNLQTFQDLLQGHAPGQGWVLALVDRAGVRIARTPEPERFVNRAMSAEFRASSRRSEEGVLELPGTTGIPVLTAFRRVGTAGWTVAVGLETSRITAPAWRAALRALLVGVGMVVLGLALAQRLSRGITGPIAELRRRAAGEAGTGPTGLPEVDEVAEALRAESLRRAAATASLLDSERRLRLVIAELNHRAKNALATVQAIALQTARGEGGRDPARFNAEFAGRLRSLARAHDLLAAHGWEPTALDEVVRAGLAPWLEAATPRITLRCGCGGAPPAAAPAQAQALVLALHELATNALKYGALSVPEGEVQVGCGPNPEGGGWVRWEERGGPAVLPPARQGFGTRLLERGLARDLGPGAAVSLQFPPEGARALLRFAAPQPIPSRARASEITRSASGVRS